MTWLFAASLRPYVALAACASLALNLALLMPSLYTLQVFERVFASRSVETLAMLSIACGLALAFAWAMDAARARALATAGRVLDERLAPAALAGVLRQGAAAGRADVDAMRDVGLLRAFLSGPAVLALFDAPWLPLYLLVIGLLHPALGVAAALGAVALVLLCALTEHLTRSRADAVQGAAREAGRAAQSLARQAEVIRGMGMGAAALAQWQSLQDRLHTAQDALGGTSRRLAATARIARQALQVLMLGLGAWLVVGTHASPGIMVAATILLGRALQPAEQLIAGWKALLDARAAWQRLRQRAAPETASSVRLPAPSGALRAEGLVFAPVPGREPLIRGLSFRLAPGESLGIVGSSASGKTTLLRLLLGIHAPQAGHVRLDGAEVSQWPRDDWGRHVGYLPQDVALFPGTVAENIARLANVDKAVDSERVIAAARLAQAHDMILRLPQGYDTPLHEAAAQLSGGQRQRIGLARALYGEPRLVVLDEPNAHLDAEGEAALAQALAELKARRVTVVMVGHRPSLMQRLDLLAVLREGRFEAFGPTGVVLARLQAANSAPAPRVVPATVLNRKAA